MADWHLFKENSHRKTPMAIRYEDDDNILFMKFPYNADMVTSLKGIGMIAKKTNIGWIWRSEVTRVFVRDFIELFPETNETLAKFQILPSKPAAHKPNWKPSSYLMDHQRSSAETALIEPRYGFFHDTGVGKTISGVEIFKQKQVRTLIVCPLSIIETAWMDDLKKFAPEIQACNLWKLFDKKKTKIGKRHLEMAKENFDLYIVNFESFKGNLDYISSLGIEMLQIDESSKIKNAKSQITKLLIQFGDNVEYCYLFSGTPAPNNELEYWSQMRMIDIKLSGRSYYVFRAKYFYSYGFGNYSWRMKKETRQEFLDLLAQKTEVIKKQDVLDLPERTNNTRKVVLTPKEMKAYKQMEKDLYIEVEGKEVMAANSAVKIMKLREGSSGFYIAETEVDVSEDEIRVEKEVVVVGTTKLKELEDLLDEIGGNQVIIWNHFHYEADIITEMLEKKGKNFVRADGTVKNQSTKDKNVLAFKNNKVQYLVAHPASVGHGNTFIDCSYAIYFSLCHSYELFKQSRDRIYRKGQVNKCTYYYLCAKGTVDLIILNGSLARKRKVVNAVFKYLKHLQEGGHPDDFRGDDGDDADESRGRIEPAPQIRENFWEQPSG